MKYTLQDKKIESGSYTFEHELDGLIIIPKKGKEMKGIDIKEVVIRYLASTSSSVKTSYFFSKTVSSSSVCTKPVAGEECINEFG